MEILQAAIEACSREGEGHTATSQTGPEGLTRDATAAVESCPTPYTANPESIDGIDVFQVALSGVHAQQPQRSDLRPNVPTFLATVPLCEEGSFSGLENGSYDTDKTGYNKEQNKGGPPISHDFLADVTADHGHMAAPTCLNPKMPMSMPKAGNAQERRDRIKARNIYHAQQSRRRQKMKRAVLEQETAWLQRDIKRLEAEIRTMSQETGLYLDVLLNHECQERGVIPTSQ